VSPPGRGQFGEVLRAERLAARLSQEELAARAGLSSRSVSDIERGRVRSPRADSVRRLADALGLVSADRQRFESLAADEYWAGRQRVDQDVEVPEPAPEPGAEPAGAEPAGAVIPAQLPHDVAGFTGRATAMAELDGLRAGTCAHMVTATVTGAPGVGKTALAVHWAHRWRESFTDGQLFVNLGGSTAAPLHPVDALAQMLRALGVPAKQVPPTAEEAAALFRSMLAGRRVLVLLDDAADASQVRPLLPGASGCMSLITSRDRLLGLAVSDGAHLMGLDVLTPDDAAALLGELLGDRRRTSGPQAYAQLAALCGHLPLALRIAAAQILKEPGLPVDAYVDRLKRRDRLAYLDSGLDHETALSATFADSYLALDPAAKRSFRLVSLVPGPTLDLSAAAALLDGDPPSCADTLDRLVAAHLLSHERRADTYAMGSLLRAYGQARAHAEDSERDRTAALTRYLVHLDAAARSAAEQAYPHVPRLPASGDGVGHDRTTAAQARPATAWLDDELPNLTAAALHARDVGPRRVAWSLADSLRGVFLARPYSASWESVALSGVEAAAAEGDVAGEAASRLSLANACVWRDRYEQAMEEFTIAAELARAAGWDDGECVARIGLGNTYRMLGNLDAADAELTAMLDTSRRRGPPTSEAFALDALGLLAHERGDLAQAATRHAEALVLHRAHASDPVRIARTLINLGDVNRSLRQLDTARRYLTDALRLIEWLGEPGEEAYALRCLAETLRDAGELDEAQRTASRALAAARKVNDRRVESQCLQTLGGLRADSGQNAEALTTLLTAAELAEQIGNQYTATEARLGVARVLFQVGDHARADSEARSALTQAQRAGFTQCGKQARELLAALQDQAANR
jgi:transcriptional regulator with XRE-family HTH domain/tetratricopeptide (TPR) repeat protein